MRTLMQVCPICEHAREVIFLQQDSCLTSPKKIEKVIFMCFKLLFWILYCIMERDYQRLFIPPLTMCFCLVDFHIDSVLPGFCWLLERGVAKSLSFCWEKLQDCAHACVSPCPRLFCPHSWWVSGKRQRSLQCAWTWFLVARHIMFLCSQKIFLKICN